MKPLSGFVLTRLCAVLLATGCSPPGGQINFEVDAGSGSPPTLCNYEPSGDLVPVGSGWPETFGPSAIWAVDRFAVAFQSQRNEAAQNLPDVIETCSLGTSPTVGCEDRFEITEPTRSPVVLSAGVPGYSLCWSRNSGAANAPRLEILDLTRRTSGQWYELGYDGWDCAGLVWSYRRHLALLKRVHGEEPGFAVLELDPRSNKAPETAFDLDLYPNRDVDMDSDGNTTAVVWSKNWPHLWVPWWHYLDNIGLLSDYGYSSGPVAVAVAGERVGVLDALHENAVER